MKDIIINYLEDAKTCPNCGSDKFRGKIFIPDYFEIVIKKQKNSQTIEIEPMTDDLEDKLEIEINCIKCGRNYDGNGFQDNILNKINLKNALDDIREKLILLDEVRFENRNEFIDKIILEINLIIEFLRRGIKSLLSFF